MTCLVPLNVKIVMLGVRQQHSSTIGPLCMMGHKLVVMILVKLMMVDRSSVDDTDSNTD